MAALIGEAEPAASVAHAARLGAAPLRLRSTRTRVLLAFDVLAALLGTLAVGSDLVTARPALLQLADQLFVAGLPVVRQRFVP